MTRQTICDQVRLLLSDGKTRTCMQILHQLGDPCSSDSLSSSLLKMVKRGELVAVEDYGPRRGRGYRIPGEEEKDTDFCERCGAKSDILICPTCQGELDRKPRGPKR